jgi:predicted ATPase with chaperone activity
MNTPQIDVSQKPAVMVPPSPNTIEETGLAFSFLADLALKTAYSDANCTTERVAEKLRLPVLLAEHLLQHLYREKLLDVRGGGQAQQHRYGMLDRGWERASRLLDMNGYIGPAPISLDAYTTMVRLQEDSRPAVPEEAVDSALRDLVLPEKALQLIGVALNSRRSLFMSGPAGGGKTSIARAVHQAFAGELWIPYAIEVDGFVIRIFDEHTHVQVDPPSQGRYDRRWVRIKPPIVIVGGELTIKTMDLIYSTSTKFYEAPFQMKSNGGLLVIDDFGRQRVEPRDLLNRWIIPLENRTDYLTLHTGKKIQVPFEQMVIFATNLDPHELVDEAFLRRMGYRLSISSPTEESFIEIFRRYLDRHGLAYEAALGDTLLRRYGIERRQMKSCEPRDLIERCFDICRYEKRPLAVTQDLLARAWNSYFGIS